MQHQRTFVDRIGLVRCKYFLQFLQVMDRAGFNKHNPIMKPTVARLKTMKPMLSMEDFTEAINTEHFHMIQKALTADVCIPDWDHFSDIFRGIYEEIKELCTPGCCYEIG